MLDVFNPNILIYHPPNSAEGLHFSAFHYNNYIGVRMRIMPRARYWKNSMNNHVILKGVDVEVIKVIQLASEVHN